jgi:hypothetical protein
MALSAGTFVGATIFSPWKLSKHSPTSRICRPDVIRLSCCRGNNNTVENLFPIVQHFLEILLIVIQLCSVRHGEDLGCGKVQEKLLYKREKTWRLAL